ncbi:hypothetical protein ACFYMX_24830 [Streptomyces griseofuscus]|uniref:hypothetical protein n=1 Tax=Streptomyces griseofuscus TaxID=146922 RepID=UPI00367F61DC
MRTSRLSCRTQGAQAVQVGRQVAGEAVVVHEPAEGALDGPPRGMTAKLLVANARFESTD